jgi:short-subunit dehydrogenase|tara:strand:+ start:477 stop:635 length:159 start_codon:yes stop_codon:yes gene_type:complete
MMQKNSGHIVSIASIAGIAGTAGMTDYCASKFAAYGLNEALRVEMKLLKKKI